MVVKYQMLIPSKALIGRSYMFLLVSLCGDGLFHALRI